MTDGTKIAAAILAVEAAKQLLAMNTQAAQGPKFDVSSNLINHFQAIAAQIEKLNP